MQKLNRIAIGRIEVSASERSQQLSDVWGMRDSMTHDGA